MDFVQKNILTRAKRQRKGSYGQDLTIVVKKTTHLSRLLDTECKLPQLKRKFINTKNHPPHPTNLNDLRLRRLPPPILILLPIRQDVPDARAIRQLIHLLEILPGKGKRLGRDVRDILADQLARIDGGAVDFLEEEGAKGLDAGAEEGAVEGDVDALEGDGGEAALQVERLGLGLGLLGALADDVAQVGFDVVEGHGLHEGLDVDFLRFDVVGDVGQAVEGSELCVKFVSSGCCWHGQGWVRGLHLLRRRIACWRRCS